MVSGTNNPFFRQGEDIQSIASDSIIQIENYISNSSNAFSTDIQKLSNFITMKGGHLGKNGFNLILDDLIQQHLPALVDILFTNCILKYDSEVSDACDKFIFSLWDKNDSNDRLWTYFILKISEELNHNTLHFQETIVNYCDNRPKTMYSQSHWYIMWYYFRECEFNDGELVHNARKALYSINEHGVEMEQWELEPSLEIIIDKLHGINDSRLFWDIIKLDYWKDWLSTRHGFISFNTDSGDYIGESEVYIEPIPSNLMTSYLYDYICEICLKKRDIIDTEVEIHNDF